MKAGESFKLSYAWWKAEKAETLLQSGVGKALKAYEAAEKKFRSKKEIDTFAECLEALEAVDAARIRAIKLCIEPIHKETKAALEKDGVIEKERKELSRDLGDAIDKDLDAMEKELDDVADYIRIVNKDITKLEGMDDSDPKAKDLAKTIKINLEYCFNRRDRAADIEKEFIPALQLISKHLAQGSRLKSLIARKKGYVGDINDLDKAVKAISKQYKI